MPKNFVVGLFEMDDVVIAADTFKVVDGWVWFMNGSTPVGMFAAHLVVSVTPDDGEEEES